MKPGYHEIYSRYRDNITRGVLKPGDKVPAIRMLAEELKVARKTVETAYAILTGEGYLVSQGARARGSTRICCCRIRVPLRNSLPVRFRHRSSASASGRGFCAPASRPSTAFRIKKWLLLAGHATRAMRQEEMLNHRCWAGTRCARPSPAISISHAGCPAAPNRC